METLTTETLEALTPEEMKQISGAQQPNFDAINFLVRDIILDAVRLEIFGPRFGRKEPTT